MNHVAGPAISAEICRVCEMVNWVKGGRKYHRRIRNSVCKGPEATESLLELTFPEPVSKPCRRGNSRNRGLARGTGENQQAAFP